MSDERKMAKKSKTKKEIITLMPEDGEEHNFEELVRFKIDKLDKTYLVLIPEEQADDDEADIYPVQLISEKENGELIIEPVETDEEWDLIEETLNTLLDDEII